VVRPNNKNQAYNIFSIFKPEKNVLTDKNCGLYSVCNTLNDHKKNKITSIFKILQLLGLNELPNHWWVRRRVSPNRTLL